MNIENIFTYFSYIPFDWIIIGLVAILIAIDAIRSGPSRAISLSIAIPISFFLNSAFYGTKFLGALSAKISSPLSQAALFIALLVVIYLLVRRMMDQYGNSGGTLTQAAICGISSSVLFLVIWIEVPSLESIWKFGPQVQAIFGGAYQFWWTLGAYSVLAFSR
ncbi:MAG TPA: hypothetical protein VJH69_03575 [Candidatus Paceibacterota bacterium]